MSSFNSPLEAFLHWESETPNRIFIRQPVNGKQITYTFKEAKEEVFKIIEALQSNFNEKIITQTLEYKRFKSSTEEFLNYYQSNPDKPFCKNYIQPKLKFLLENFSNKIDNSKVKQ